MDFFTLINLLLTTGPVATHSEVCPRFKPLPKNLSYRGRIYQWNPDNHGFSPFNTFDQQWHLRLGFPLEIFVTISASIVLNVTIRCQQPDNVTGNLPPLTAWRAAGEQAWLEKNFEISATTRKWLVITGCKQISTTGEVASGKLCAYSGKFDGEDYNNRNSCNFVTEFVITRDSRDELVDYSGARAIGRDWKLNVMAVLGIILNAYLAK